MTPSEITEFAQKIDCTEMYVVCMVNDLDVVEEEIKKIKDMGYAAYLRKTAMGNEIVVSQKL